MMRRLPILLLCLAPAVALGQEPGAAAVPPPIPPIRLIARDSPNDQGEKIQIGWLASLDEVDPVLPTIPLDPEASPRDPGEAELIEREVELDKSIWYAQFRRPVREMLTEEDPVLSRAFPRYVSGIVERHVGRPMLLDTALGKGAPAWLRSYAGKMGIGAGATASVEALADLLAKPEELRKMVESRDERYLEVMRKIEPALAELSAPETLWAKLLADPALADLVQDLLRASNQAQSRGLFRSLFARARERVRVQELQDEVRTEIRERRPDLAARLDEKRQAVRQYVIQRSEAPDGPWRTVGVRGPKFPEYEVSGKSDLTRIEPGKEYFFRIVVVGDQGGQDYSSVVSAVARAQWWHFGRTNNFFWTTIFIALIVGWIWGADRRLPLVGVGLFLGVNLVLGVFAWAGYGSPVNAATLFCWAPPLLAAGVAEVGRRSKELYIRPIAGIQAVEEAIGRATEMGKPILFVPGLSTIEDIATLAALNILGPVAEKAAEYDSKIIVPNRDPIVFTIAQEIVKESYLRAGRPDSFDESSIYFVTGRQFAYAAAVNGLMLREKPATNFFLGMFWAESLLLAETGSMTGAIQIAGTDAVTQLPFFIVTCDYTLIGEELYAAGAYMGKDPKLLGGLKGQDYNKAIFLFFLILFAILFFGFDVLDARTAVTDWFRDTFEALFRVKN